MFVKIFLRIVVIFIFFSLNIIRYILIENIMIFYGVFLIICFVWIVLDLWVNIIKIKVIILVIIDIGIWINLLIRYLMSSIVNIIYESLNNLEFLIVFLGFDRFFVLNVLGMDFLKYNYKMRILVIRENILGMIIWLKYLINLILK